MDRPLLRPSRPTSGAIDEDDLQGDRKTKAGKMRRGISAQSFNFHLQAGKSFFKWMVKDGRATENPLAYLTGLNVKLDRRHDRRALTPDELARRLAAELRTYLAGRPRPWLSCPT